MKTSADTVSIKTSPEQFVSRTWDQVSRILSMWIPILCWTIRVPTSQHSTEGSLLGREPLSVFSTGDTNHTTWMFIGETTKELWIQGLHTTAIIFLPCPAFPFLRCSLAKQLNMSKSSLLPILQKVRSSISPQVKAAFANLLVGLCTGKLVGSRRRNQSNELGKKMAWDSQQNRNEPCSRGRKQRLCFDCSLSVSL